MSEFQIPLLTPIQVRIFNELSHGKSLSREVLVNTLNTPRTTIYDNLIKLQNKKLVLKFSKKNTDRPVWGRPLVLWYIPRHILKEINNETKDYYQKLDEIQSPKYR